MARTNFTAIGEALDSLITSIAGMHADILAKANAERREALELHARMQDTYADIVQFNAMVANAADALAGVDEVATDIGMKIYDVLEGGFDMLPECDYEEFVGFCAACGQTIHEDDDVELIDGEFYHKECAPVDEELDEDEDADELDTPAAPSVDVDTDDVDTVEVDADDETVNA
jgi:hypothetical protein